jgi:hypothetical protein
MISQSTDHSQTANFKTNPVIICAKHSACCVAAAAYTYYIYKRRRMLSRPSALRGVLPSPARRRIGERASERASEWSRNSISAGLTMSLCWCLRFVWWPSCLSIPRAGSCWCKMTRSRPKSGPAVEGHAGRSPRPRTTKNRTFATTGQVCLLPLA